MKNKISKEKIEEFYKTLYDSTDSKRKKKNLEVIYNILLQQYEMSSNNFTVAHIGKMSQKEGGPIAQTIRNKQGKDYKDLIEFFANNVQIVNSSTVDTEYNLSDYIDDPVLKAHINILIAENKSLKNQLNILKQNMSKNFELNYIDTNSQAKKMDNILLNSELESIKNFLANIETEKIPIKLSERGSLIDENGTLIATSGFAEGLKKILL